jgi:hypothetical protein
MVGALVQVERMVADRIGLAVIESCIAGPVAAPGDVTGMWLGGLLHGRRAKRGAWGRCTAAHAVSGAH